MKTGKFILTILTLGLLRIVSLGFAQEIATYKEDIVFNATQVLDVLKIYKEIAQVELIIDSHATYAMRPITLHTPMVSRKEGIKLIEKALLEQAGIIVTHLDDKRTSITPATSVTGNNL